MQLAINALLCLVAFSVLSNIIQFRRTVNQLARKLRIVMHSFRYETIPTKPNESALQSVPLPALHGGIFTRDDVESQFDDNSWQGLAYHDFRSTLLPRVEP
ncbi:hypothetical protein FCULG_00011844 [Fusarium culmorum]|uniref:Uncharacterized protein n=1 Tax=Fusarium culmorum TaxID=5516 RepID=A0A2T4GRY7_FUSCU|nr:hypothetical protein FCULG_00011844 [Fusarium culmorum]